jgi:hypothetical protein
MCVNFKVRLGSVVFHDFARVWLPPSSYQLKFAGCGSPPTLRQVKRVIACEQYGSASERATFSRIDYIQTKH